jgi:hypothetical protein
MAKRKTIAILAALANASVLCGCVSHTWAPGPTANKPFEQASGQCQLVAMGVHEGFGAIGSPGFVASAALGNALGNAVRSNRAYNACMEAQGFVAVDAQQQARQ